MNKEVLLPGPLYSCGCNTQPMRALFPVLAMFTVVAVVAQPANDECTGAMWLPLRQAGQCPSLGTLGDNVAATQSGFPACADTAAAYKDIWYWFNSGPSTEVTANITFVSIDEWGIEVLDACNGTSVFCDSTSSGAYTVPVATGTDHRIRFFTNSVLGSGGSFTICLVGNGVTAACEAGVTTTDTALDSVVVCKDGQADLIGFSSTTTSPEAFTFVVMDSAGIIVYAGVSAVDFDALALGTYTAIGISYNGSLVGAAPQQDIDSVSSTGTCIDIGTVGTTIVVDICQALTEGSGALDWAITTGPEGNASVHAPVNVPAADLQLVDLSGRIVQRSSANLIAGGVTPLQLRASPGLYVLSVQWPQGTFSAPVLVR